MREGFILFVVFLLSACLGLAPKIVEAQSKQDHQIDTSALHRNNPVQSRCYFKVRTTEDGAATAAYQVLGLDYARSDAICAKLAFPSSRQLWTLFYRAEVSGEPSPRTCVGKTDARLYRPASSSFGARRGSSRMLVVTHYRTEASPCEINTQVYAMPVDSRPPKGWGDGAQWETLIDSGALNAAQATNKAAASVVESRGGKDEAAYY